MMKNDSGPSGPAASVHRTCCGLTGLRIAVAGGLWVAACLPALAQYREGAPEVIPAPVRPPTPMPEDLTARFRAAYAAAGSPRIALYWNVVLSDEAKREVKKREVETTERFGSKSDLSKATAGPSGNATLNEGDSKEKTQTVKETSTEGVDSSKRINPMSPRNAAALQSAFLQNMTRAGVQFIDRAMSIRLTAVQQLPQGADPQLIETRALIGSADWMMQVLMVPDDTASVGIGFDVSLRQISSGAIIASAYTKALLPPTPSQTQWLATNKGFEKAVVSTNLAPTIEEVAWALAQDTMATLGPALQTSRMTSASPKR